MYWDFVFPCANCELLRLSFLSVSLCLCFLILNSQLATISSAQGVSRSRLSSISAVPGSIEGFLKDFYKHGGNVDVENKDDAVATLQMYWETVFVDAEDQASFFFKFLLQIIFQVSFSFYEKIPIKSLISIIFCKDFNLVCESYSLHLSFSVSLSFHSFLQTLGGAVVLTDIVYWLGIFPLLKDIPRSYDFVSIF